MYEIYSQMSHFLMEPVIRLWSSTKNIPLLGALLLGLVGALAPCQFTGNLGAITIYGNKSMQERLAWKEVFWFIFGKIIVFSGLGLIVWLLGSEVKSSLTLLFPWVRKVVGPMLIIIGLITMGIFKINRSFILGSIPQRFIRKGKLGAFLLGVSFTLGFCPTMFTLFFLTLMPLSLSVPYGPVLPVIFALGTALPLILTLFLIWYFELSSKLVRKNGRKVGLLLQRLAGIMIIVIGIFDTITYWSI